MSTPAMQTCPMCGETAASSASRSKTIFRDGRKLTIEGYLYSRCDQCESEFLTAQQARHNKIAFRQAEKRALGLLTGREVKGIREKLAMSQADAARIFGGGPNAFSKYENEEVTQSEAMDKLIRLASAYPVALELLSNLTGEAALYESRSKSGDFGELMTTTIAATKFEAVAANDDWQELRQL